LADKQMWVDPVPSGGGIINGGAKLAFDSENRPVVSYHKNDADGNMQIYAARPEKGKWQQHLLTNWDKPVNFSGNGSMGFVGIRISAMRLAEPGVLTMTYRHRDYGSGRLILDETSLEPVEKKIASPKVLPSELDEVQNEFEGMQIKRAYDLGESGDNEVKYILQWDALKANRDRRPENVLPQPSVLMLHRISSPDGG
jgi:hypothetical protein